MSTISTTIRQPESGVVGGAKLHLNLASSDPHPVSSEIAKALEERLSRIDTAECQPGDENSFFVCDLNEIRRLVALWRSNLPRVQPFYAVKCNPNPRVIALLAEMGVNFDCASKREIELVLEAGVSSDRIIYANPCKVGSFIRFADQVGVRKSTFDNLGELCKIARFHPQSELLLRISTDDSTAQCRLSTKFGAHLDDVPMLLQKAKELGLNVVGVSFHVGSGASDFSSLYQAVEDSRAVFDMASEMGFQMKILDVGGGFQVSRFNESSPVLNCALDKFFPDTCGVEIIAEPGRFMVATAFTLACNVIAKRQLAPGQEAMIYINDGVYGNMNCILFDHQHPVPRVLKCGSSFLYARNGAPKHRVSIWGPTCDGLDCVNSGVELCQDLEVGDWLYFSELGAYTNAATTNFNGFDGSSEIIYV